MAKNKELDIPLPSLDELFSTQELPTPFLLAMDFTSLL